MIKLAKADIYVFLTFATLILSSFALNYSGFCFREFRYLSAQEQIESFFNLWNRSSRTKTVRIGNSYKELKRERRYANFEEFLEKHPDCCQINPGGGHDTDPPDFINRILGYDSGTKVLLKFNEEFLDEDGRVHIQKIEIVDRLQNCGESRW